jgi:hypothetical protein
MLDQKCRLRRCFWISPKGELARPTKNQSRQPDSARKFHQEFQKSGPFPRQRQELQFMLLP